MAAPSEESPPPPPPPSDSVSVPLLEDQLSLPPPPPESNTCHSKPADSAAELEISLSRLQLFLRIFGFCQHSPLSFCLSWLSFLLVGVTLPFLVIELYYCYSSTCQKYQLRRFEIEALVCEILVAAVALILISHNLYKYGVRKFLFVDKEQGNLEAFREEYGKRLNGFFRLLAISVLPCLFLKTVREILRMIYVHHDSLWQAILILFVLLISWTYTTTIYISATALFSLVCSLQIIHFDNYVKLLETDLEVYEYIKEHIILRYHLSKISHRFRIFLVLEFVVVIASQLVALLETTGNLTILNFINGADFVISSVVQVVGVIICLHAATKITTRAHNLASIASRWHALVTCGSEYSSRQGTSTHGGDSEAAGSMVPIRIDYSESDLESADYVPEPTTDQLASYMSSYQKRQSYVIYMQSNPGGVTLYGWAVDRGLLSTIFFIELSIVTFVLSITLSFST